MTSPEVDLADWETGLAPLNGAAQSTTHFVAGRGTRFGAGLPNLFTGGMYRGYSWYEGLVNGANGGLIFAACNGNNVNEHVFFSWGVEGTILEVGLQEPNPDALLHIHDKTVTTLSID